MLFDNQKYKEEEEEDWIDILTFVTPLGLLYIVHMFVSFGFCIKHLFS